MPLANGLEVAYTLEHPLPLEERNMDEIIGITELKRRYRILSLDGGGIKGTYTAAVLESLEKFTGKSIGEHFDLIAGTSTGGIIAIAIGLGIPLRQILDLYMEKGGVIFPAQAQGLVGRTLTLLRHFRKPKHSQTLLAQALGQVIGDRKLGESKSRLVIPAFNAVNGDIQLFKTAHTPAYQMDYRRPAAEVALATSAAPTFFSAFQDNRGGVYLDGGVWANCPAVVALTEATSILGWPLEQIDLLSIGTTRAPFEVGRARRQAGLFGWNVGVIELLQQAQGSGMLGIAKALTKQSLLRIDEATRPGRFSLDNSAEVSDLRALGENSARQNLEVVCDRFLSAPVEKFEPCLGSEVSTDLLESA